MNFFFFLQEVSKRFNLILLEGGEKELKVGLHFAVIICTNSEKTNNHNFQLPSKAASMKVTSLVCIREKPLAAVVNLLRDPKGRTITERAEGRRCLTFVVDLPVSIDVCFSDHLVHFLVGQLLSQVCHDVAQLCGADVSIAILRTRRAVRGRDSVPCGKQGSDEALPPCAPASSPAPPTTKHMQAGEAAGAFTKQRKWQVTVKKPGSKFLYYLLCLLSYDKVTAISQIFENEVTDGEAGR